MLELAKQHDQASEIEKVQRYQMPSEKGELHSFLEEDEKEKRAGYEQKKWEEEHLQQATLKFGAKDAKTRHQATFFFFIKSYSQGCGSRSIRIFLGFLALLDLDPCLIYGSGSGSSNLKTKLKLKICNYLYIYFVHPFKTRFFFNMKYKKPEKMSKNGQLFLCHEKAWIWNLIR